MRSLRHPLVRATLKATIFLNREFKVALPQYRGADNTRSPKAIVKGIHEKTQEFLNKATHLQQLPPQRFIHRRLEANAWHVCEHLVEKLEIHRRIIDSKIIGASAHSLSLMQDTIWDGSLIPESYMALLMHLWKEAGDHVDDMSATDVASMLYAHYSYRHFLQEFYPKEAAEKLPLMPRLLQRFEVVSDMATSHDALSALLGLSAVDHKDQSFAQRTVDRHIIDQIPIADHEIIGLIAYAIGQLHLPTTNKYLDGVIKRFQGLKPVEYATLDVDIYANVLYGLGAVHHRNGKLLAEKLIRYIDRAGERQWRPRTITRLAWGVARLDAHTPSFVGKILRETIRSGRFFTSMDVQLFQEAIDEMNVEPTDDVWQSLSRSESRL